MSTADVAAAALELSNLRTRLARAASEADHAMFTNDRGRATGLRNLTKVVDETVRTLQPYAFYTDPSVELLLSLSVAVAHARGGDPDAAGQALVEAFAPKQEAA